MAGKYASLENYLRDLPKSQREVAFRFAQIERILAINCRRPRMKTGAGGIMRQKATTSISAPGQMLAGRLRALI